MKYFHIYILLLFSLFSALGSANGREDDYQPVYRAITEKVLPGIANFIEPLVPEASEDYSDSWFISRVQCAYLSWAKKANQAIAKHQDSEDDGRLISDEQQWHNLIAAYCNNLPMDDSTNTPDISDWLPPSQPIPGFPIEDFISEQEGLFSPVFSYIQQMPSYEMLDRDDVDDTAELRKRIILEGLLLSLGRVLSHNPDGRWAKFYTDRFTNVMSDFHCSRFIKADNQDFTRYQNCESKQSDADVQRSNQAVKLTDIALGKFNPANIGPDPFDTYGYQPGFAFAGSHLDTQWLSCYPVAGYSVIAETFVFMALLRGAFLR